MELNPNHEVTSAMRGEWHKIVALLMLKHGTRHVVLSAADLGRLLALPNFAITVQELPDGIHLRIVDGIAAERLAREQGGLPA